MLLGRLEVRFLALITPTRPRRKYEGVYDVLCLSRVFISSYIVFGGFTCSNISIFTPIQMQRAGCLHLLGHR